MAFAQITLIGNIGSDPDMSYTADGTAVTKFSIAVTTKQSGQEVTNWYRCTAWRKAGETINQYAKKGDMLFVQGDLNPRSYTTKEGKSGFSLDVTVNQFQFTGSKNGNTASKAPAYASQGGGDDLGELDDHPF